MSKVVMFEIHASDPQRAVQFYGAAFGWRFENLAPNFYQMTTENSLRASIFRRRGAEPIDGQPLNAWACTLQVDSVDEALAKVQACGGRVAVPKYAVPGFGWGAYFKDTEGNIVGVFEPDAKAG